MWLPLGEGGREAGTGVRVGAGRVPAPRGELGWSGALPTPLHGAGSCGTRCAVTHFPNSPASCQMYYSIQARCGRPDPFPVSSRVMSITAGFPQGVLSHLLQVQTRVSSSVLQLSHVSFTCLASRRAPLGMHSSWRLRAHGFMVLPWGRRVENGLKPLSSLRNGLQLQLLPNLPFFAWGLS